uniref:DUF1788 domain-containing protein n=1 Tax=Steinernema glaseri TaxID=37863 RepID=A0A1I8A2A1_9BILA
MGYIPSRYKEITLDHLQKLVDFIRPVKNKRHPLRKDYFSLCFLSLHPGSEWINEKVLSMRLPVDSVELWIDASEEMEQFFESAGFLYFVSCRASDMKQHTIDTILEKFSPVDNGFLNITMSLNITQVNKLFEKCALSEKKVAVIVSTSFSMKTIALADLIDFGKYYPTKAVREERTYLRYLDASKLEFRVKNLNGRRLKWQWSDGIVPWKV